MSYRALKDKYGKPLCERKGDGITVSLFAQKTASNDWDVRIFYSNSRTGDSFTLNPPRFLAIEAFRNPRTYADANLRGIENPFRLAQVAA